MDSFTLGSELWVLVLFTQLGPLQPQEQTPDLVAFLPRLLPWEPALQSQRRVEVDDGVLRSQSEGSKRFKEAGAQLRDDDITSCLAADLQEALGELQQVDAAVAAVVLLRNAAGAAPHGGGGEEAPSLPPNLPLHLQVAGRGQRSGGQRRCRRAQRGRNSPSDESADVVVAGKFQGIHDQDARPAGSQTPVISGRIYINLFKV